MKELLTKEEAAQAAAQGWGLYHVFDSEKKTTNAAVLPTAFSETTGARRALEFVVARAHERDPLCIRALTALTKFNQQPRKKQK